MERCSSSEQGILCCVKLSTVLQDVCYQYWPQTGSVQFREYSVDLMEEKTLKGLITRKLVVT